MSRIPLGVYAEAVMDLLIQQNHRRSEYRRYVSDHRHSPFRIEYVEVGNVSAPREPLVVLKRCTTLNGNNGNWTNTDDVKPKQPRAAKKKKSQGQVAAPATKATTRQLVKDVLNAAGTVVPVASMAARLVDPAAEAWKWAKDMRSKFRQLRGRGDYEIGNMEESEVVTNSLIHGHMPVDASFGRGKNGLRQETDRYCIGPLVTATPGSFEPISFDVTISNRQLFGRLATIAKLYERVRFLGLVVVAESEFIRLSTDGSQGLWAITCAENPYIPAFSSTTAMLNANGCAAGTMAKNLAYGVECANGASTLPWLYTDRDFVSEPALTTLCKLQVAMYAPSGATANTIVGRLWVTAHVEYCNPRLPIYTAPTFHMVSTACSSGAPLGTLQNFVGRGGIGNVALNGSELTFQGLAFEDIVRLSLSWLGTSTALAFQSTWKTLDCFDSVSDYYYGGTSYQYVYAPATGTTSTALQLEIVLRVNRISPSPKITFSTTAASLTPPASSLMNLDFTVLGRGTSGASYNGAVGSAVVKPPPVIEDTGDNLCTGDGLNGIMPVLERQDDYEIINKRINLTPT